MLAFADGECQVSGTGHHSVRLGSSVCVRAVMQHRCQSTGSSFPTGHITLNIYGHWERTEGFPRLATRAVVRGASRVRLLTLATTISSVVGDLQGLQ